MKIVVIEAWGLHLGYLGCYGNDWVATPNLDRLAAEGIVFDWHIADQPALVPPPWPQRSIATGRYAPISTGQSSEAMPGTSPTVLRCESITTFAADVTRAIAQDDRWLWVEGPCLLPPWNLDDDLLRAYFDEDDDEEGLEPWRDPPLDLVKLSEAEVLELQNTYAAVVTVFDAQLGSILEALRTQGALDGMLLCVTSSAGMPLGEHGMIGTPRPGLHDELVHLPLVMRMPGGADAGLHVSALTQPVDLLPTFRETLGQTVPGMHGCSLWPLVRGEVDSVRPYAVASHRIGSREARLLRTEDWAFHLPITASDEETPRKPQMFAKPDDRWEVNDLIQQQSEGAEWCENALHAFAVAIQSPGPLTYPVIGEPAPEQTQTPEGGNLPGACE